MSARAEGKGWQAHTDAVHDFLHRFGGDESAWTPEQRAEYERLIAGVDDAADRHDAARGRD